MTTYKKPDVEVFQQFTDTVGVMSPAVLQLAIIGPMYQLFNESVLGSYDNTENLYYMPSELLDTSVIDKTGFTVNINQYGETFHVPVSTRKVTSANGVGTATSTTFTDDSVDFIASEIVAHTSATSDDGDYLHIPVGANAGYYKILAITDSHTIEVDVPMSVSTTTEEYNIITVGYVLDDSDVTNITLTLTPNLGSFGDVVVTFKALRRDNLESPYYWDSYLSIENATGKDQVTIENPLPHVCSKVLPNMGTTSFVIAVPTDGNDYAAYEKALEVLENLEVYSVVPLTQDKDIHMMVKEHVLAMSAPEEKRERVGIVSAPWMDELVKTGFFSVTDGMTGPNGLTLDGQIELGGESTYDGNDVIVYEDTLVPCDAVAHVVPVTSPTNNNRVVVNYGLTGENTASGTFVEYELASNPGTYVAITADADDYHAYIKAPSGDNIINVRVTSAQNDPTKNITVATYNTTDELAYTEYASMTASGQTVALDPRTDSVSITAAEVTAKRAALSGVPLDNNQVKVRIAGLQNFINGVDYVIVIDAGTAYVSWANLGMEASVVQGQTMLASYQAASVTVDTIVPTPGHKGLKVRRFNVGQANPDPLSPVKLPEGMKLYVITANHNYTLTYAGSYNFPEDIVEIYKVTSTKDAISNSNVYVNVDLMVMTAAGTYERNRFIDLDGQFISKDNIEPGDILSITTGANAGRYEITSVKSDRELIVDTLWTVFEENLTYQIVKTDLTKDERADMYKSYGEGFGTRRMVHVMAPIVGIVEDGLNLETVPGYYACAMVGAYAQVMAPQNGMTNMALTGITRAFFTSDYFLERQLNTIASGGNFIIAQPNVWVQPFVRHQLTTNMDSLERREFSAVRALDYMAKMGRETYRPYIGKYLINEETMTTLYSVGNSLAQRWMTEGLANSASLKQIYVDPTQRDRVIICMDLELPIPLNYIKLVLYV